MEGKPKTVQVLEELMQIAAIGCDRVFAVQVGEEFFVSVAGIVAGFLDDVREPRRYFGHGLELFAADRQEFITHEDRLRSEESIHRSTIGFQIDQRKILAHPALSEPALGFLTRVNAQDQGNVSRPQTAALIVGDDEEFAGVRVELGVILPKLLFDVGRKLDSHRHTVLGLGFRPVYRRALGAVNSD